MKGEYIWGVLIEDKKEMFMLKDSKLTSTGNILKEGDIYNESSIQVKVNPKTGEGDIIDSD